jgi:hypothetical protein
MPFPVKATGSDSDPDPRCTVSNVLSVDTTSSFCTEDEPNQWVMLSFEGFRVRPSGYILRSIPAPAGSIHPRGWIIEGSGDGFKWTELDRRSDETRLNDRNVTIEFEIRRSEEISHIRLRQTQRNHCNTNTLALSYFDVIGIPFILPSGFGRTESKSTVSEKTQRIEETQSNSTGSQNTPRSGGFSFGTPRGTQSNSTGNQTAPRSGGFSFGGFRGTQSNSTGSQNTPRSGFGFGGFGGPQSNSTSNQNAPRSGGFGFGSNNQAGWQKPAFGFPERIGPDSVFDLDSSDELYSD